MKPRRVLSMWQPWATFVVQPDPRTGLTAKQYETRAFRAQRYASLPIECAIHATARVADLRAIEYHETHLIPYGTVFRNALREINHTTRTVPLGAIIGVATIIECVPTEDITLLLCNNNRELIFGNYTPGRWAWRLAGQRMLPRPIPFKGRQSVLWAIDPETDRAIDAQLAEAK